MKNTKEKEDLKKLSIKELIDQVDNLRRNLFSLRLNAATAHIKDYSQFSKLKKNIARALTEIATRS